MMLSSPINITHNATSVGDINPTSTTARTLHQCRVSPLHWGPKAPKKKRRRGKRLEPNNGDERCGSNEPLIFSELHPHRIKGPSMSQSWVISSPSCFLGDRALGHNFLAFIDSIPEFSRSLDGVLLLTMVESHGYEPTTLRSDENARRSLQCVHIFSSGPQPLTVLRDIQVCCWNISKLAC